MPAHAAGTVVVKVVSLGIAGVGSYIYNAGPALLFPAPPGGEVGVAYSDQLTVTGGTSPFTWSVSTGALPPGLALAASSGLLSGTPTTAGTYSFTVKVTDQAGLSDTEAVSLPVIAGPSLSFQAPPAGWTNTVYTNTLTVSGGTGPYAWSVSSGSLPAGISLSPSGVLSGTPTATGTFSFTVKVTDANAQIATQATSITISAGVSTTFAAPPAAVKGAPYSVTLTATGGTLPYTWSVNAGTLPPGLTLSSAGVLAGTPTAAGSYPFSVNVIDKNGGIATASITLVVGPGLSLTFGTPPGGQVGVAYTDTLTAAGGTTPYTWSVSAGTLPAGITLGASTGVLAGTPTAGGTSNFTIKVTDAAGQTATQPTAITILAGAMSIAATASAAATAPGATVSYTVKVTNTGPVALTGATFTDPLAGVLDDAAYNSNASATAGTVSFASPNLTWTGNLAIGASATITFSVTVSNPDTGNKILAATITSATAGSNCASGSTDPACTVSIPVAVLTIAATASASTATPGTTVGYTITVTNAGQVAYPAAGFTDALAGVLDDASYNLDASATAGSVSFASPNLSWTGSLAIGASATVTFSVTVNSPDTGNKTLASTITSASAGNNCASDSTDPRCVTSVSVLVPGLTIALTANTASTTPGSAVGYTVTVTNSGQTPYTGAAFTDSLAGVLSDASYNADASATAGTVSFASPNLSWTGNLAIGASATITFSVTVKNPDTGDKLLASTVTSVTAGSNCPAGGTDPRCSSAIPVLVPGLNIAVSAGSATTTPGAVVHYTVTVTNSGQTPQAGATFTDPLAGVLDDAAYNNDASATAGTVSFASPNLTWTGTLAVGASATVTFSVTVSNPDTGNKILATTITSATPGSNCAVGSGAAACTSTVNVAVLTISNSSDVSTTTPGGVVRFTATFTNAGQVAYTGITIASNITNVLDDATPNGDQTATSGTLSLTATGISWTGSIPAGGTVTVTGTVTVNNPDTGSQVLASTLATAAPGSNCPAGGTDPACSVHVTVLTPALSIVKTANASTAVPGQTIGYTVTITNSGQTPYSGAVVSDSFAQMADDAVYNGNATTTAGSLSFSSPVLTWTGDLAPGASAVITYTVTVDNPDTGDKLVINTVSSAAAGSTCPPGSVAAACRVTVPVLNPALTIVKTAATTSGSNAVATPGGVVTYTVTVTNTGQTPYTGAAFSDPLGGVLDDAAYNNDAVATAGTVTFTSPVLSWTGDLAPGAAAVITYSVTVNNPDTGDQSLANTVTSATPGSNCPTGAGDARCTATVTVRPAAALTFTQTAAAPSAVAGATVAYTITIVNSGGVTATGASFTDPLGGVLDDAAYNNDAVAT
ncbi:MAG TPA: putative Ig domain-containing protein, partial [Nakamurella sp.]